MTRMFYLDLTLFVTLAIVPVIHQLESFVVEAASCKRGYTRRTADCSDLGLRFVPRDLLPDITDLDLRDNLLTTLENGTFSKYPSLEIVNLYNNNISLIDTGAFTSLKDLEQLHIGLNALLPTLQASMFGSETISIFNAGYSHLKSFAVDIINVLKYSANLYLYGNKLQKIHWTSTNRLFKVGLNNNQFRQISRDTFVLNIDVYSLDLSENPIEFIEATAVSSLQVKVINLGNTHLTKSQWSSFFSGIRLSTSIINLELADAELHTIKPGFFRPLKGKNLDELNIASNGLGLIHDNAFSDLTEVSQLVLSDNGLQGVEPTQFNGMASLRSLILDKNKIIAFNSEVGTWNFSLTELNLAGNSLRELNSSSFQGLTTLEILNLSENSEMHVIDPDTFANFFLIQKLDLSATNILDLSCVHHLPSLSTLVLKDGFCPIEFILPGNLGRETPSLSELNLSGILYSPSYPYMWDPVKNISSFFGLHSLLRLSLSNNFIIDLTVGLFTNLTNLQILDLSYNSLVSLKVGVYRDLENLIQLDLSNNDLSALSPGLFDQMGNLRNLILIENGLTYLDSDLFKYCISLLTLDISDNTFTGLNKSTLEPLSSLSNLNIASNPLVCNCDLKWFHDWLKGSVLLLASFRTTCLDSPGTLKPFRGKPLINFDPGEECNSDITLYSFLGLVGVAVILALGVIYYQRWWIRYRLFLLKLCFIGYEEIHDDVGRRDLEYDLAIMHHETDNEWVNQHLRPALVERVPDYDRIVCGDEELMLGMYYLDAVNYATEQSFKTIIVISREALQDQWFIMKFRTVLDHVNDVGTEKMVIVFVEDIPGDELPFLIRLFLSDHRPYLVWPDDERGQDYFWEELIKDLTVNIRCNHLVPP